MEKVKNSEFRIENSGGKTLNSLFSTINFPKEAFLHKRITKKMFLENASLGASDKKCFKENVKNVYWEYTLKPSTCPVLPYRDNEREYLEVAVLQVEMNSRKGHKRIAEVIHRIIPYPLFLVFQKNELREVENGEFGMENENNSQLTTLNSQFALSIAPKRFSQAEHGAFVAERFYTTGWISTIDNGEWKIKNELDAQFIHSLVWENLPLLNYGVLYQAWVDRFTGYECSVLSGAFTIGKAGDRLEQLTRYREIQTRISELRGQLKKAAFNRQVELNTQIKKFEQELKQLTASL